MPTVRQNIWDAVITQLKTITVANGYVTAIGTKVDEWRTDYDAMVKEELPRLNVLDVTGSGEPITLNTPIVERTIQITIEGFVSGTGTDGAADNARALLGDIQKALFVDQTFGGFAQQVVIGDDNMVVARGNRIYGACEVKVEIQYNTNGYNPSSQG